MNTQDDIKQEAKKFLNPNLAMDDPCGVDAIKIEIHENMFTKPIEKVFSWCEDDYQGQGFVVYRFGDNYLFTRFCFGSCAGCLEEEGSTLVECFDHLLVSQELSMNMLKLAFSTQVDFVNPDLVREFKNYLET